MPLLVLSSYQIILMHGHYYFKIDTYVGLSNFSELWWRSIRVRKIFCTSRRISGSAASDMWSNGSINDMGNVTLNCLVWYFVPTWKKFNVLQFLTYQNNIMFSYAYIYPLPVNRLPELITGFCQASHSDSWLTLRGSYFATNNSHSTRSPFVTLLSRRAQYGRWSSFGKRVWFTESHIVLFIQFTVDKLKKKLISYSRQHNIYYH